MSEKGIDERITEVKTHIIGLKDAMERYHEAARVLTQVVKNCNELEGVDYIEEVHTGNEPASSFRYETLGNLHAALGRLEMEKTK